MQLPMSKDTYICVIKRHVSVKNRTVNTSVLGYNLFIYIYIITESRQGDVFIINFY